MGRSVSLLDGDGNDAEVGGGSLIRDGSRLDLMLSPFPVSTNASEILSQDDVG
jgi:hypothetical protein